MKKFLIFIGTAAVVSAGVIAYNWWAVKNFDNQN